MYVYVWPISLSCEIFSVIPLEFSQQPQQVDHKYNNRKIVICDTIFLPLIHEEKGKIIICDTIFLPLIHEEKGGTGKCS